MTDPESFRAGIEAAAKLCSDTADDGESLAAAITPPDPAPSLVGDLWQNDVRERDELRAKLAEVTKTLTDKGVSWALSLRSAEHRLAAAQARVVELKALLGAIQALVHTEPEAGDYRAYLKRSADLSKTWADVRAALAKPDDLGALREFGLRVARLAYDKGLDRPIPHADFSTIVAAVLEGHEK